MCCLLNVHGTAPSSRGAGERHRLGCTHPDTVVKRRQGSAGAEAAPLQPGSRG